MNILHGEDIYALDPACLLGDLSTGYITQKVDAIGDPFAEGGVEIVSACHQEPSAQQEGSSEDVSDEFALLVKPAGLESPYAFSHALDRGGPLGKLLLLINGRRGAFGGRIVSLGMFGALLDGGGLGMGLLAWRTVAISTRRWQITLNY